METRAYFPNIRFDSPSEALVAIKKMSPEQKERMLLDLVWKCYVRPKGLRMNQIVVQSYNTSVLVP